LALFYPQVPSAPITCSKSIVSEGDRIPWLPNAFLFSGSFQRIVFNVSMSRVQGGVDV
jgi:hypothetical protein